MIFRYRVVSQNLLAFSYSKTPYPKSENLFSIDDIKIEESSGPYKKVFYIHRKAPRLLRTESKELESNDFEFKDNQDPNQNGEKNADPSSQKFESFEKILPSSDVRLKKRDVKLEQKEKEENDEENKELPVDDVSESQDRKRKKHKTTEFFYLLERKALRMMRRYYKEALESYATKYKYKQNLKRIEKRVADQYFREYIDIEFANNKDTIEMVGKEQLLVSLQTIILCDRYNKNEKVTEGLEFDEIRNLLNKYNSKNLKEFFENHSHAFLYAHYYRMSSAEDVKNQGHVDEDKLIKQMESLFKKSVKALPDSIKTTVTRGKY